MRTYDPEALLGVLVDHGVRFVVVGGFAAVVHGSPLPTYDVDITPERGRPNLTKLATALRALDARIRVENEPEGVVFDPHPDLLLGITVLNLVTRFGELDLVLQPAGDLSFDDLSAEAVHVVLEDLALDIASLAHVIASKTAANRAKDRAALPVLRALLARTTMPREEP